MTLYESVLTLYCSRAFLNILFWFSFSQCVLVAVAQLVLESARRRRVGVAPRTSLENQNSAELRKSSKLSSAHAATVT